MLAAAATFTIVSALPLPPDCLALRGKCRVYMRFPLGDSLEFYLSFRRDFESQSFTLSVSLLPANINSLAVPTSKRMHHVRSE
jgi:hypothetical protein